MMQKFGITKDDAKIWQHKIMHKITFKLQENPLPAEVIDVLYRNCA